MHTPVTHTAVTSHDRPTAASRPQAQARTQASQADSLDLDTRWTGQTDRAAIGIEIDLLVVQTVSRSRPLATTQKQREGPGSIRSTVRSTRYPLGTMSARKLRDILFRSLDRDEQLLLAVTLCTADADEASTSDLPVLGVTTLHLFCWLQETASDRRPRHPSIDQQWHSEGQVRAALVRLKNRGLVRGTPPRSEEGGASQWRTTPKAGTFLRERLLFRDAA